MIWLIHTITSSLGGAERFGAAPLQRGLFFDDPTGDRGGSGGFRFDVVSQQRGDIRANDERQNQHRHDRRSHKGEEQLAIERAANLAKQDTARLHLAAGEPPEEQGCAEQQHIRQHRQGSRARRD